jgi:predicted tellurium resistance membrane protein TerC
MGRFHLLKYSLVIILALVGAKMLLEKHLVPHNDHSEGIVNLVSFAVIALTLLGGILASFIFPEKESHAEDATSTPPTK